MQIALYNDEAALAADSAGTHLAIEIYHGTNPEPYPKELTYLPGQNGALRFHIDKNYKFWQRVGRTLGKLGIFSFCLRLSAVTGFTRREALELLQGLRVGRHDDDPKFRARVCLPLGDADLAELSGEYAILDRCRALADGESRLQTPYQTATSLLEALAAQAREKGLSCRAEIITPNEERFRFAGLSAVGRASANAPCMGIFECAGDDEELADPEVEVALVGKGVTFDAGGYDLKSAKFMETMWTDKCGAVYLAGALMLAIRRGFKKHTVLYLPCTENLVGPTAMMPGEILHYQNGLKVEINNTDAEGRLILADGLIAATERHPKILIDAATLTGAAKRALGRDITAVFTPGNILPPSLTAAFARFDELLWVMPLIPELHNRFLSSNRADLTNSGHGDDAPGASVAAMFLNRFVPQGGTWVHFDLCTAYKSNGDDWFAPGATGSLIAPLGEWLAGI